MKFTKRLIALLVCVLMVIVALPVGIFAETTEQETVLLSNDFDFTLDFNTAAAKWSNSYFRNNSVGSNFVFAGNTQSTISTKWGSWATEENGNGYIHVTEALNQGYSIKNAEGYDNFNKPFKVSLRMNLSFNAASQTSEIFVPVIRLSDSTNAFGGTSGFTNVLAVVAPKTTEAARSPEDEVIGTIGHCTTAGAGSFVDSKYTIYANTWYDIEVFYNPANGMGYWTVTDGTTSAGSGFDNAQSMDMVNQLVLFRCSSPAFLNVGMDDVRLTSTDLSFDVSTDMSDLEFATVEDVAQTYASSSPGFFGFTATCSDKTKWNLVVEDDNKYISHVYGSATRAPLTWTDDYDILDLGDFAFSYDFKWGEGASSSGAGMLSVKIPTAGATSEFRVINMGKGGALYFGPTTDEDLKIATLTTESDEGYRWHSIKVVFKPYITETLVDMRYEFYIDGQLAAYTEIVNGSHNFYTKASGEWTVLENLKTAKYVQYIKSGDANENGTADEGEEIEYGSKWIGTDEALGINCTWGNTGDNVGRLPIGYWDGYEHVYIDGVNQSGFQYRDGAIANIASFYMFHWNDAAFSLDNVAVKTLTSNSIENVDLVGYQIGNDKTSLRLIAGVDSLGFGNIGMDVEMYEMTSSTGWVMKENARMSRNAFVAITADEKSVSARELGASYVSMLSITDIDSSGIIRVTPYTTKEGARTYGDPVVYAIQYAEGAISVTVGTTYVQDFSDGVVKGSITDGYAKSSYDALVNADGDYGYGGQCGTKNVSAAEGALKFTVTGLYAGEYHTDEGGNKIEDGDGNTLIKKSAMSGRIKFAHVIPCDYEQLIGKTLIITAKVKVAEISGRVEKTVTVGGVDYTALVAEVASDGATVAVPITFFEDMNYSAKGTASAGNQRTYTLSVSDEWTELVAAINITEEFVAALPTIDGSPYPLRPAIGFGSGLDAFISEGYIDDVTCTIVPTLG